MVKELVDDPPDPPAGMKRGRGYASTPAAEASAGPVGRNPEVDARAMTPTDVQPNAVFYLGALDALEVLLDLGQGPAGPESRRFSPAAQIVEVTRIIESALNEAFARRPQLAQAGLEELIAKRGGDAHAGLNQALAVVRSHVERRGPGGDITCKVTVAAQRAQASSPPQGP